ncbi:putative metallophosphoesterase At3g03305 isoform X2 [Dendrobium catenatum]|uniref:putative metallophosphoesterase At3g03305 isoform X2 n=1 Tax=Dendrobium catenatum TaxID=906689 RepID=UPI0010A043E6|nr:putative metallophosphoesterase At3g03305 isoform X2 [Dendrobium catenatum]
MASPAISSSAFLPFFLLFFSLFLFLSSADETENAAELVSREFFPMDGDLAWVVQVSDLHLSAYHPERAEELAGLLGSAIRVIRPDLLLVTGDITDAKNSKRTSTRQDELEWIQYRNAMDTLVKQSGLERRRIFDIRGNHDKYGVPYVGSALDFFSIYSVSSQFKRLGTIQSVSLVGDDQRYIFLGIDDTMRIGVRGPSNLFGHPTGNRIRAVEAELQHSDNNSGVLFTKVVFGHFPMSFTASAEKGERYEPVFARHSVSAYICGHLHSKFGKQLWRLHTSEVLSHVNKPKTVEQFWEWELGDWKEFRFIRILAIDRGDVSFMDIKLSSTNEPPSDFKTAILVTYPMDSRSMSRVKDHTQQVRNDINALVFSVQPILNVTANILDSSRDFKMVEEIPLQPATDSSKDSQGKQTASILRPFSVEGKTAKFSPSWLAFLVFDLQWEEVFHVLQWSNISFLILLLCFPKIVNLLMERNSSYQKWAVSVSISSSIVQRKFVFRLFWFLIEGSRVKTLWYAMVIYLIYLLTMPWFWGHATSEKGNIFKLCLSGWRIQSSSGTTTSEWLGFPDLMTITLPFMYFIVTPLFLLIYSFSAERSAACFYSSKNTKCSDIQMHFDTGNYRTFIQSYNCTTRSFGCKICAGWLRKALLFASAVIACLHFKLVSGMMEAYGAAPVALSPAVSWVPPLLLAAAIIYSTK